MRENTKAEVCDVCGCLKYPGQGVHFDVDFVCYVCIQAAHLGEFDSEEEGFDDLHQ